MQSKGQIQQLLAVAGASPKRQLGQNFLIDHNLMHLLLDSADIQSDDLVLEVGPGTGSLTEELAQRAGRVIAVEIDDALAQIVSEQVAQYSNTQIINADILKTKHLINPEVIQAIQSTRETLTGRFLLVANLPYNIAAPLMMNLVTAPPTADAMFVTVQKEVAERMTAQPPGSHYGTLSILLSATGTLETIRTLKPTVFWPRPQVDSAMVAYTRDNEKADSIKSIDTLTTIVNTFMQHRRKTIHACARFLPAPLSSLDFDPVFARCAIDPHDRPDHITPAACVALANTCRELVPNPKP
jgi:16S rRNA (adenine1518-N6/adenine1519-N6)-dimethyltransferase